MLSLPEPEPGQVLPVDPTFVGVREIEARVHKAYLDALGKTFRFPKVYGWRKNVQEAVKTRDKVLFRVIKTDPDQLVDWSTNSLWLDPIWRIEVVDDPQRLTAGLTGLWFQATSFRTGSGASDELM